MKKFAILIMGFMVTIVTIAQTPQAFKYQAVARKNDGSVIANQAVSFRISILKHNLTGDIVFGERHNANTNEFGLVTLDIGNGIPVTGSLAGIDWGADTYFIRIEMDPNGGTAFLLMGTSQLLSVPYALHARTVEIDKVDDADHDPSNEIQSLALSGRDLTLSKGGGTITLPSIGDNWGTQFVITDASFSGNGTGSFPLGIAQRGATTGQVLKWNGSAWVPGDMPSTGDNWGTQTVARDNSLAGNGTAASPLQVADNGITSAKIADGTITSTDLAGNSVDASKIVDLSVGTNDLANNSVTGAKIADGTITNPDILDRSIAPSKISYAGATASDVLLYDGTSVAWDKPAGVRLRTTLINVTCAGASTFSATAYTKIGDLGTFTKSEANSIAEVTFEGRIGAASMTGTGAHFELRVDGNAPSLGRARAVLRSAEAGYSGVPVSITGVFTGLAAGNHTVSMWVKASNGTGTDATVDPGCFSDDHVIVFEVK